jgi:hypothetical protein
MTTEKFVRAIILIDEANSRDPTHEISHGVSYPKELLYSMRMSACLERLAPEASEELHLATRGQHLCRWMVPRSTFPDTREGYLRWRGFLYKFHADKMREILVQTGYDRNAIEKVANIVMKKGRASDPEVQCLEDVACLVFLKFHLTEFAKHHPEEKLIAIIQKTWRKMSSNAHQAALRISFSAEIREIIAKALS